MKLNSKEHKNGIIENNGWCDWPTYFHKPTISRCPYWERKTCKFFTKAKKYFGLSMNEECKGIEMMKFFEVMKKIDKIKEIKKL